MAFGRSKILNRSVKTGNTVGTSIECLPKEVITTILALVASKSLPDLMNAKLSCKYFLHSSDDDLIFEKASIDKFRWWNKNE